MSNNISNDSLYQTSNTGNALSFATTKLKNVLGPITLGLSVTQTGAPLVTKSNGQSLYFRDGLCLSDFADTDYSQIQMPVLPSGSRDFGNLVGAISSAFANSNWSSSVSYTAGEYVYYFDGISVNLYKCISDVSATALTPKIDTAHWQYYNKAFYLRLIPCWNGKQPGLDGTNRFLHYAQVYANSVDMSNAVDTANWLLKLASASHTTYFNNNGLRNSKVIDKSTSSSSLGLYNVNLTGTITNNTIALTHDDTGTVKIIVGTKVKIKGGTGGVTYPFVVTVTSSTTTGFNGNITSTGNFSATTNYSYGDFVHYPATGTQDVYYVKSSSAPPAGTLPTNTTYWTKLTGSIAGTGAYADPIINTWNVYLDTAYFEQTIVPIPAGSNSSTVAQPNKIINNYKYNDQIINQKQTLFKTSDYIIHDGFPFDKDSITGASMNITASITSSAIIKITNRPSITSSNTNDIPASDGRFLPISTDFNSFAYPANSNYIWSEHGATGKNLQIFNDDAHTYLPDLLDGTSSHNPSANSNKLQLSTPDNVNPPLTAITSLAFKENSMMFPQTFNPFKVDGSNANTFATLMVLYPDFVPSAIMKSTITADETNWFGILSEATQTGTLGTDTVNWYGYKQTSPRLSVKYKLDGTVSLYLGDALLTAIRPKNGISRPLQPLIIGFSVSSTDNLATLTVVDSTIHRVKVPYTRNWLAETPVTPNTILYGAVPYNGKFNTSKMYVLEINHYYSNHTDDFYNNEIQKLDKMYAITSGRA